jgi:hypothetical protein
MRIVAHHSANFRNGCKICQWLLVKVGPADDVVFIQHISSGGWAFVPSDAHEKNLVELTADLRERSVWKIKTHQNDEWT